MLTRIAIVSLTFLITACSVRTVPFNTDRMPDSENAGIVEEVSGSYCFCSRNQNIDPPSTDEIGGIAIDRLATASIVSIQAAGNSADGIAIAYSTNTRTGRSSVFDSSTGGCFIGDRRITCQRPVLQGVKLGIGWYTETTDFRIDTADTMHITDTSSECGLGLLIIPFCESYQQTLKMQKLSSGNSCKCEQ